MKARKGTSQPKAIKKGRADVGWLARSEVTLAGWMIRYNKMRLPLRSRLFGESSYITANLSISGTKAT
jgi:hypothetical protein